MSVSIGSIAASHQGILSVSYIGGNRRQKKPTRGDGGLIDRITGLRVLVIIVKHYLTSRDADHGLQKIIWGNE